MQWLDELAQLIEEKAKPTKVFLRDDDAPWEIAHLEKLLARVANVGLTMDVATIPNDLTQKNVSALRNLQRCYGSTLRLHQHGFSHRNQETHGRKCEFGPGRSVAEQMQDIGTGKQRLADSFDNIEPIFTPPWNRCTQDTVSALKAFNFKVLSRIEKSATLALEELDEVSVTIDWEKKKKGRPLNDAEFAAYICDAFSRNQQVGIMFHHAEMSKPNLDNASKLLKMLKNNGNVIPSSIIEISRCGLK